MALDPTADRPLSSQLADVLRSEIHDGTRPPGSQLPTESEFHEIYGVSRTTARAALQQLVNEGLVVTRKGYGSLSVSGPRVNGKLGRSAALRCWLGSADQSRGARWSARSNARTNDLA
ncbi:MAG TPA: GntR family transcriptional regulator, partial [Actinomycetes bacterium]|nr:GntR family transcriptional regulator [Actinomycetes bacterium]